MRGRSWRLGRMVVAVAFVAVAAVLVGTFTATRSASHAPFVFTKGDPDSSIKTKAGIANEGPDGSLAAQLEAQRAYPADAVPAAATANSQATFADLSKHGKGQGAWESIGPSQAKYPAVLDQFLAGGKEYTASGRVTALAIGGCKKESKCSALPRRGRRRRLGRRQGDRRKRQRALAVQVRLVRDERDRLAARRSARPDGQHRLRGHRRAERLGRLGGRQGHLQVDRRRRHVDARSRQRPLPGSRSRHDGARRGGQPARRHRQRDSRRQLGHRRLDRLPDAGRLRRPRRLPADRGDVHAAAGDQHPRHDQGRGRSEQPERALPVLVRRGCLALARQRRDVDADQDGAEPGTERRPHRVRGQQAAERQDADVRRRSATRALRRLASSAPTTQRAQPCSRT